MHKLYRFNEDRKGFGQKLKELMIQNGYTVEGLAADFDYIIGVETIKKWRNGSRIPDISMLKMLSKKFGVTMHQLYMPNSIYEEGINDETNSILNKRMKVNDLSLSGSENVQKYGEYLFQKLLFSFLSFKEKGDLKILFNCYKVTKYGKEKLKLTTNDFESFYISIKAYIQREFGKSLPYTIDEKQSKVIYSDFEKMIEYSSKEVK